MCCFGIRVFALIFSTLLSFILHGFYPALPVIGYYLIIVSLISFGVFSLFVRRALPSFVKPAAVSYFSAIGGVFGSLLALLFAKRLGVDKFSLIQYIIALCWVALAVFVLIKFEMLRDFFGVFFDVAA